MDRLKTSLRVHTAYILILCNNADGGKNYEILGKKNVKCFKIHDKDALLWVWVKIGQTQTSFVQGVS